MVAQPGICPLHHGTHFEKPGLLRADGAHLSEEGNSIFIHSFDKMTKTLIVTFQGREILIQSIPASLMLVPAVDAQKPAEVSQASRPEEHMKSTLKEFQLFQPISRLNWGPSLDASMEDQVA